MLRASWWILLGSVALLTLAVPESVFAYVGPGTGLSVIGSVVAFLGGLILAIVGFVWYPLKRFLTGRREKKGATSEQ